MDAVTPIRGVARQVGKDGATVFKVKAGRQVSGALTKSVIHLGRCGKKHTWIPAF